MLDGFIARRMFTESERGAKLDSIADLFFVTACLIKILPSLPFPRWLWYWTAGIFIVKIAAVFKKKCIALPHTSANKMTGLLLFLQPLLAHWVDVRYLAVPVCLSASVAAVQELLLLKGTDKS